MTTVLVLGGAGMLGHKLVQTWKDDFDVWATVRSPLRRYARYRLFDPEKTIEGVDVGDFDSVVGAFGRVRPDVVINCVGIIKQLATAHDPIISLSINSLLPHRLQRLCGAAGARLIHISTDCVFRGDRGMYTEEDPSDAVDLYGRTKFLGETSGESALTVRTSIIGRELETRSGLVEWFLANRGKGVKGYRRAIYTGFTTHALSRILRRIITVHPELTGTLQVSSEPINKYDLLLLLNEAYSAGAEVLPDDSFILDRSLDSSRFRAATGFEPPSWRSMIEEMAGDQTPYDTGKTAAEAAH